MLLESSATYMVILSIRVKGNFVCLSVCLFVCVCRLSPNYCIVLGGEKLVSSEFDQLFRHQGGQALTVTPHTVFTLFTSRYLSW